MELHSQGSLRLHPRTRDEIRRDDWLRDGVLSGFAATFAMTVVVAVAFGLARVLGHADGNQFSRWLWTLTHNTMTDTTVNSVILAIALNLLMGLVLGLIYGRFVEPMIGGPGWQKGALFSLVPWIFSVIVFLPIMGGGLFGRDIHAGPLPVIGNLLLHLVYGVVLGSVYGIALESGLDDTDAERANAAAAERGAAAGVAVGLVAGAAIGWIFGPSLGQMGGSNAITLGTAMIGGAIGLGAGSFYGMGRASRSIQTRV